MELKIIKGNSLLAAHALFQEDEVYLPASALDQFVSPWGDLVFYNSPLEGKQICLTVLSPNAAKDALPPWVDHLIHVCQAAGAEVIWHDGGPLPACDLLLVLETGVTHISVSYLGAAFRSAPLAKDIARAIKKGLKLAYLPDPLPFKKPEYNIKPGLWHSLFTPSVAIGWPVNQPDLAGWLFTSLLTFWGDDEEFLEGTLFPHAEPVDMDDEEDAVRATSDEETGYLDPTPELIVPIQEQLATPAPEVTKQDFPEKPAEKVVAAQQPSTDLASLAITAQGHLPAHVPNPAASSAAETAEDPLDKTKKPHFGKPVNPAMIPIIEARRNPIPPRPTQGGNSAGMSRAQYPEFFKKLEEGKIKQELKKEPFS